MGGRGAENEWFPLEGEVLGSWPCARYCEAGGGRVDLGSPCASVGT